MKKLLQRTIRLTSNNEYQGALFREPPGMNPIFFAKVKNSKLKLYDPENFNKFLLKLQDKEIQISLGLVKKTRTIPQNRFLWGVCYQLISEATGYTREEVHDAMRMMFLRDEERDIPTLKSTTSLTTIEMNEYWERIQQFAAEKLNLIIPAPDEVDY